MDTPACYFRSFLAHFSLGISQEVEPIASTCDPVSKVEIGSMLVASSDMTVVARQARVVGTPQGLLIDMCGTPTDWKLRNEAVAKGCD